ncbi:nucleotide exchange factor GrpE [Chlorobaculum limnaeum]|uniref:Protein GrpE n=1 Tax=Chlorobaculum limnaeum TaxID=274537 RepID=A0A1D8CWH6_CHLLM|nr:nucleotide exchange factor GrpE [Chlorobaculum limnaeum]AOS83246.1 nucleotide exchange factor GrpE [Chlorobaculum limnaeum]
MTRKESHHKEKEEIKETIDIESPEEAVDETVAIPAETGADMEAEIAARDAEITKLREEVMRRAAEFENFRKQKEREAAQSGVRMLENTVRDLLPMIDDLKRLMSHIPAEMQAMAEAKPFIEGVELIRKNFMSLLEKKGVKEIEAKGKQLDVNFHEAITQIDAPGVEPDTIVDEYQTGYTLGDRVIRHARVIVAR